MVFFRQNKVMHKNILFIICIWSVYLLTRSPSLAQSLNLNVSQWMDGMMFLSLSLSPSVWAERHFHNELCGHLCSHDICGYVWAGSRSYPMVHCGRAVLPGSTPSGHGCCWLLQLDGQLPGWNELPQTSGKRSSWHWKLQAWFTFCPSVGFEFTFWNI